MTLSRLRLVNRLHGIFNIVSGIWPVAHMRSFEAVLGRKTDHWLVYTVAGLLFSAGVTQLFAADDRSSLEQSRRIGVGCAATLATIDLVYAPSGRISRMYLFDALAEIGWVIGWLRTRVTK